MKQKLVFEPQAPTGDEGRCAARASRAFSLAGGLAVGLRQSLTPMGALLS